MSIDFPELPPIPAAPPVLGGTAPVDVDPADSETIDWDTFRFPPRPGTRSAPAAKPLPSAQDGLARAPVWAAPPRQVETWSLDMDRLAIVNPRLGKRVDLSRVNTRHRLCLLLGVINTQENDKDTAALLQGVERALKLDFGWGWAEMLSQGPESWVWPSLKSRGTGSGRKGAAAGTDFSDDDTGAAHGADGPATTTRRGLAGF